MKQNHSMKKTIITLLVVWFGILAIALATSMIDNEPSEDDFVPKDFHGEISLLKDNNNQTIKFDNKDLFIVKNLSVEVNGLQLECSSSNSGILCSKK